MLDEDPVDAEEQRPVRARRVGPDARHEPQIRPATQDRRPVMVRVPAKRDLPPVGRVAEDVPTEEGWSEQKRQGPGEDHDNENTVGHPAPPPEETPEVQPGADEEEKTTEGPHLTSQRPDPPLRAGLRTDQHPSSRDQAA